MKKKGFKFKSIKARLITGFLILIALTLASNTYILLSMSKTNAEMEDIIDNKLHILILDESLAINMLQRHTVAQNYLTSGNRDFKERYNEVTAEGVELEEEVLKYSKSDELRQLIEKKTEWGQLADRTIDLYDSGNTDGANSLFSREILPLSQELSAGFVALAERHETEIAIIGDDLQASATRSTIFTTISASSSIIIGVLLALFMANEISSPLKKVTGRMRAIADGDLTNPAFETELLDETGQLMQATDDMSKNLVHIMMNLQLIASDTAKQSDELDRTSDASQSDTEQIAATMEELASGTETQARTASDLATSMDSFARTIQSAYASGQETHESSIKVLELANEGKQQMEQSAAQMQSIHAIVKEAAERMEKLDQQTDEITQLVEVVHEIADQTNLLALNASIEAARAGEHGRGFAVVAEEVRKLAEQVSDSVAHITTSVGNIQEESDLTAASLTKGFDEVEKGTVQLKQTGEAFNQINHAINLSTEKIQSITKELHHISETSQTMASSIDDIAAVSQESAAGVEQTAASAQQIASSTEEVAESATKLSELSEKLDHVTQQFKI